ncbi:MAG TPA: ATP-binding protein [bacterium]|nr:ATP-binding protein [bacterium]HOL49538.1 ATP-binding protein [bacterium]HPO52514.1 ATP-binding protein [bacterium]HXK44361.1 ATP-binding protein [bacterium]
MKDELVVPPILENLSIVAEFLQEKIKETHLTSRKAWELLLVTDEICSHIIHFRKYDSTMGKMRILWEGLPDKVVVTIETSGIPFNPLELNSMDNVKEEEEESLGGMGIHLVKQMIDEIDYKRTNNSNILKITKLKRSRRNRINNKNNL